MFYFDVSKGAPNVASLRYMIKDSARHMINIKSEMKTEVTINSHE